MCPASNSQNLPHLLVNELKEEYLFKYLTIFFFTFLKFFQQNLLVFDINFLEANS